MTIEHKDIVDPYIHEPKGASTASNHTVYISNGSGSGSWTTIDHASIDMTDLESELQDDIDSGTIELNGNFYLTTVLADVSTASSVLVPIKDTCDVVSAEFVLGAAITSANATVNIKTSTGTSMGTDVSILYTSSAKGDKYAWTATTSNSLTGPTWIEVTTDGASSTTAPLYVTIKFSQKLN